MVTFTSKFLLRRPTRLALTGLVISLVTSALIGIAIVILGEFNETDFKILATSATIAGVSVALLPGFYHLERTRYKRITLVSISTSIVFFAMILYIIWGGDVINGEWFAKLLGTFGVVAFSANHTLLLLIPTSIKIPVIVCQRATILIIVFVVLFILTFIWTEVEPPEVMMRLFAAMCILDALGTIVLPILTRIFRDRP